jgi:hypothetical protein
VSNTLLTLAFTAGLLVLLGLARLTGRAPRLRLHLPTITPRTSGTGR